MFHATDAIYGTPSTMLNSPSIDRKPVINYAGMIDVIMPALLLYVTVKLSVSINESLPEIELAEAKFLSKEAFSIG